MKKIDVLKSYEKVKVSLALDKETIDLVDEALVGFKLINVLGNNEGNYESLLSSKNEAQYKSILNRSDFVSRILNVISDEKLFTINEMDYSLVELAKINEDIAFTSIFNFYVSVTKLLAIENIDRINNLKIENIRDKNLDETLNYLSFGDEEIHLNVKEINSKSLLSKTESDFRYQSDELQILDDLRFTSIIQPYIDLPEISLHVAGFNSEGNDLISIPEMLVNYIDTKKEFIGDFMQKRIELFSKIRSIHLDETQGGYDNSRDQYRQDTHIHSWEINRLVLNKFEEVKNLILTDVIKNMPDITKVKILRNQLFNESNEEMVNVFEKYLELRYRLDSNKSSGKEFQSETL